MKSNPTTLLLLACCSLAASPARIFAQDGNPQPRTGPELRPAMPPNRPDSDRPAWQDRSAEHRRPAEAENVPTPFIGVVTRELESDVRAQTGLQEGYGLLVVEIMPDGPAKEAGLQQHDVLVKFDDQKLVNIDQLQVLVRSQKKGDAVTLTVRRAGADQKIKINIGERNMPRFREQPRERGFSFPLPRGGSFRYDPPPGQEQNTGNWRERLDKFQDELREYQRRLQDWSSGQRDRPMPQLPKFDVPTAPQREGGFRRPPEPRGDGGRADHPPGAKS